MINVSFIDPLSRTGRSLLSIMTTEQRNSPGGQRWGWTPTSAPVAHDRLHFVFQPSLLRAKKQDLVIEASDAAEESPILSFPQLSGIGNSLRFGAVTCQGAVF